MLQHILFVCTGNTCRSPMAEAILKSKEIPNIEVKSAGLFASDGSEASVNTKQVLQEKGVACDHRSSFLNEELVEWATYIFTMTASHKHELVYRFPDSAEKVFTLKEFVEKSGDVTDPFGGSMDVYRKTYEELTPLIEELITKISQ